MAQTGSKTILFSTIALTVIGISLAANAQTVTSPFARADKPQAWEAPAQAAPVRPAYVEPTSSSYVPPTIELPAYAPEYNAQTSAKAAMAGGSSAPPRRTAATAPAPQIYAQSAATAGGVYVPQSQPQSQTVTAPAPTSTGTHKTGSYLAGEMPATDGGVYAPPRSAHTGGQYYPKYSQYGQPTYSAQSNVPPRPPSGTGLTPRRPNTQTAPTPRPKSWRDRMGLGNIATTVSGYLKLGAAATERSDWDADFIADGSIRGEVSAITQGGLEYGLGAELRGQYDKYRRGFGGRVGDCPPGIAGCASFDMGGTPVSVRGHTSQFYTFGPSDAKDSEIELEGAYLFLRSAYGDVTIGRDDGAAYLFSLGAPTLVAVGASNSPVDYTGLDSVKTLNDASGFAEKITYTSPRLLGDTVGVGVQLGASYAPNARACGVDYCVKRFASDVSGSFAPDMKDVIELGVALDRKFDNGLSVEATATYAMADEDSGFAVFDDLEALGLGVELGYMDWTIGGSYLNSNNGLANGDYVAWDAGLTWKPAAWGITLGYGGSEDKNIGLKSDQALLGLSYDVNDNYRLGAGIQYIDRDVPLNVGGIVGNVSEDATAIFVEGRVTF